MTTDLEDLFMDQQPLLTGAMAKYRNSPNLQKKFTGMSRFEDPYMMYRVSECEKFIYVPRHVCPVGIKDERTLGFKCGMKSKFKARDADQELIISESMKLIDAGENFQIQAGTGKGKTPMGLHLVATYNRPTLVVVPKSDMIDQWIGEIRRFVDIPDNRIGIVQQNVCDYRGKWIVMGMMHSLSKENRYPVDIYDYFGMVLVDEVHRLAAETFSAVGELFSAKMRLGLSATPERQDGKETLIAAHFGPVRVVCDSAPLKFKVLRYRSNWECPRQRVQIGNRFEYRRIEHSAGKCGHIINSVCSNMKDNLQIASWVKKSYSKDRVTVVFSDRIEHLETLMGLSAQAGVPTKDMGYYIGGMKKADLEITKTKKVMFTTFQMMGEATNIPWLDTCILASPRAKIKQQVGRILREYEYEDGSKKEDFDPVVFDVVHEDSPVFNGYSKGRASFYVEAGAQVKWIK